MYTAVYAGRQDQKSFLLKFCHWQLTQKCCPGGIAEVLLRALIHGFPCIRLVRTNWLVFLLDL